MVSRDPSTEAVLVVMGDPSANFVQRSPLSAYPSASSIPGLIGYFQVDAQGAFTTPLLPGPEAVPAAYGISTEELAEPARTPPVRSSCGCTSILSRESCGCQTEIAC